MNLEENPSDSSLFKILPCYKYQNERDKFIRYSDDIYISSSLENLNKEAFLGLVTKKIVEAKARKNSFEEEDRSENDLNDDFMINFDKKTKFT